MKKYFYFVLYSYAVSNSFGFGNIEIISDSEINSFDDITDITKKIEEEYPHYTQVLVLHWELLRVEEDDLS